MKKHYAMIALLLSILAISNRAYSQCAIPAGLKTSKVNDSTVTLSWNAVSGATSYSFEVENASGNNMPFFFSGTVTTTSATVTRLPRNANFKFKVRTNCGGNHSDWSGIFTFNSGSGSGTSGSGSSGSGNSGSGNGGQQCATPAGLKATRVNDSTVTLSWNAVTGATSYRIEVENASGNNINFRVATTVTANAYTITLRRSANFKFKVRTVCGSKDSNWADWFFFATTSTAKDGSSGSGSGSGGGQNCPLPSGLKTTAVNDTTYTLSWTAATGATAYKIEVENASGNNVPFNFSTTVSGTSYTIRLRANANFKFKVRTVCGGNHSDWTAWFFFTTNVKATTCSTAIPAGLAASVTSTSANLSWTATGATQYAIEVEDASGNPVDFFLAATTTATSYTVTGLRAAANYKFKVRSVCNGNTGTWSAWKTFTTATARFINATTVLPDAELSFYPNPAREQITLTGGNGMKNCILKVYDAAGRPLLTKRLANNTAATVSVSQLPAGLYYAVIISGEKTVTKKLNIVK